MNNFLTIKYIFKYKEETILHLINRRVIIKFICCVRALIYYPEPITYITGDEIGYYCASPSLNGKPTVNIELPPWTIWFRPMSTRHNGHLFNFPISNI